MCAETFKSLDTKAVAAAYHDAVASASTEGRPAFDIASDDLRNQTEAARKLEEMKRRRNAAIRNAPPAMRRRGSVSGIDEGDLMAALAASDAAPPEEDDSEEDELPQDVKCYTDGMFMDKRYENGEVFYYDEDLDMYWRQGCKPRIKKMFGF